MKPGKHIAGVFGAVAGFTSGFLLTGNPVIGLGTGVAGQFAAYKYYDNKSSTPVRKPK